MTEILHRNIHILLTIVSKKGANGINLASKQIFLVILGEIRSSSSLSETGYYITGLFGTGIRFWSVSVTRLGYKLCLERVRGRNSPFGRESVPVVWVSAPRVWHQKTSDVDMPSFPLQTVRDKSRELTPICMWSSGSCIWSWQSCRMQWERIVFVLNTDMLYYSQRHRQSDAVNAHVSAFRIRKFTAWSFVIELHLVFWFL